jgi:hypothetical protein
LAASHVGYKHSSAVDVKLTFLSSCHRFMFTELRHKESKEKNNKKEGEIKQK